MNKYIKACEKFNDGITERLKAPKNPLSRLVKFSNLKIDENTLIYNPGGCAKHCPSRTSGRCLYTRECYALKAEKMYKHALGYRQRQQALFWEASISELNSWFEEIIEYRNSKGKKVNFFRINESGDFSSFYEYRILLAIAKNLYIKFGVVTYGFTANKDILEEVRAEWLNNAPYFKIRLSGRIVEGFPSTTLLDKEKDLVRPLYENEKELEMPAKMGFYPVLPKKGLKWEKNNREFLICPATNKKGLGKKVICGRDCTACMRTDASIAFIKH